MSVRLYGTIISEVEGINSHAQVVIPISEDIKKTTIGAVRRIMRHHWALEENVRNEEILCNRAVW